MITHGTFKAQSDIQDIETPEVLRNPLRLNRSKRSPIFRTRKLHSRCVIEVYHRFFNESDVQLSIFECDLKDEAELVSFLTSLEALIDEVDDQIRIYMLSTTGHGEDHSPIKILGRRVIEERRDFWIL